MAKKKKNSAIVSVDNKRGIISVMINSYGSADINGVSELDLAVKEIKRLNKCAKQS